MADRNAMCSQRVIREIDFFFIFLFTLFLQDGSCSFVHQYLAFFPYTGANFLTSSRLLQVGILNNLPL